MANGGFFGGFAQGLSRTGGMAMQHRRRQEQQAIQQQQLQQQQEQFEQQHGLEREKFDAKREMDRFQQDSQQRQLQLQEMQAENQKIETDLLVLDRFKTALGSETPQFVRPFLIEELAKFLGHDPKSSRVQDIVKMSKSASADLRQAMTRIFSQLEGLPAGSAQELMQMVFGGQISLHELLKLGLEAGAEEFTLSPGQSRFRGDQEIASVPPEPESFTLGQGQTRFRDGEPVAEVPPAPPETNIMGPIPPGQQLEFDEQGRPFRMAPVPGSPAAREAEEAARQAERSQRSEARRLGFAIRDADTAIKLVPETGGISGRLTMQFVPGTNAYSMANRIDSLRNSIAALEILDLRMSEVGLGQIPQSQWEALTSLMGQVRMGLPDEELISLLTDISTTYKELIDLLPPEAVKMLNVVQREMAGSTPNEEGRSAKGSSIEELSDEELLRLLEGAQ